MTFKPLPAPQSYARQLRLAQRDLRKAHDLLMQAERFFHDLSDSQCPTGLLENIRRFTQAHGGNTHE